MMNKIVSLLLIFFFLSPWSWAQNTKIMDRSLELSVGDLFPDIPKFSVINSDKEHIALDKFSDKIIVLDFFDTYCSNCIASMPKLQKLQEQYQDKIQIIMVTWQDKVTIEKFYKTNTFLKENKISLVTAYSDTLLRKYFPHRGVPHTAWIYKQYVKAITFSDFITSENIAHLRTNDSIQLPVKSDFNNGLKNGLIDNEKRIGTMIISGYRDAIDSHGISVQYDSISGMHKSSFYNIDVLGAYTGALSKIKKPEFLLKDERIIWKVNDSSHYKFPDGDIAFNEWLLDYGICYERYDHIKRSDSLQAQIILNDLNTFLGLRVYWSKKEIPCLVLQKNHSTSAEVKITEGGLAGSSVLAFMIDYQSKFAPVVDEVRTKQKLNVVDYSSVDHINSQLEVYGLKLVTAPRVIDVLVFEECNEYNKGLALH